MTIENEPSLINEKPQEIKTLETEPNLIKNYQEAKIIVTEPNMKTEQPIRLIQNIENELSQINDKPIFELKTIESVINEKQILEIKSIEIEPI